ncbi:MAG: class I SAM-dependent methyltransferase [Anaerolineales bacterium]|nr:class I SAM-dependent methyltransferase [Anaerolineales bacterium]MCB9126389.1 class I SAM-dependent methyltransferase [Ardenticatenales bacterium]MCB9171550.1 class I SAM-dependent methyltransferase [Ardenticatenales bacterium]
MTETHDIYALPQLYDLAFAYRDVPAECDFMVASYSNLRGAPPQSCLELACGPGEHCRILAARGLRAVGIDIADAMLDYARTLPGGDLPRIAWRRADMRAFTLPAAVDLAFCLVDSLSHLLTLEDLLAHLSAVAAAVRPRGLYIIEQSHPRDAFPFGDVAHPPEWTMEDESGSLTVHVQWGQPDDPFDFTSQIAQLHVTLTAIEAGEGVQQHRATVPSRLWLAGEMEAAIRASGQWRIVERFGAMDRATPWQSEPPAWRMVTILEREE